MLNAGLNKVGVVVPTLGLRPDFLRACLKSIKQAGCEHTLLVCPINSKFDDEIMALCDDRLNDPNQGLTGAINFGISQFPSEVKYVTWLGDDDLLESSSLETGSSYLEIHKDCAAVYGKCRYIDENDSVLFTNKSGQWASTFIQILPNLIPQPGSLLRRESFEKIGGVSGQYPLSFDFEMFLNLKKTGAVKYMPVVLGAFRWHKDSMSVEQRIAAVEQTSKIRMAALPKFITPIAWIWEIPLKQITLYAAKLIKN